MKMIKKITGSKFGTMLIILIKTKIYFEIDAFKKSFRE
jgi:hypothetical protein